MSESAYEYVSPAELRRRFEDVAEGYAEAAKLRRGTLPKTVRQYGIKWIDGHRQRTRHADYYLDP